MLKAPVLAAFVVALACVPGYAQSTAEKAQQWCTDAHMKEMEGEIGKMSNATKKKEARTHLNMSKKAMKADDSAGCVKHMEEAHKAMGV